MDREIAIAIALIDILVAAHFAYADDTGAEVLSQTGERWRGAVGLCAYVDDVASMGCDVETHRRIDNLFSGVLVDMYGSSCDPFARFAGGSYYERGLNYAIRSREALKIAKYIERKYL